jgi:hypothetical protein
MPRVAGLNIVAVLAGALAMWIVGALFYTVLFGQVWQQQTLENHGIVGAGQAAALAGDALMAELKKIPNQMPEGLAYGLGFLISLFVAVGLGLLMKMSKPSSTGSAVGIAILAWLAFAAPTLTYNVVYSSESRVIFGIDLLHLFTGYLVAAVVIFLIDGKALRGANAPA